MFVRLERLAIFPGLFLWLIFARTDKVASAANNSAKATNSAVRNWWLAVIITGFCNHRATACEDIIR